MVRFDKTRMPRAWDVIKYYVHSQAFKTRHRSSSIFAVAVQNLELSALPPSRRLHARGGQGRDRGERDGKTEEENEAERARRGEGGHTGGEEKEKVSNYGREVGITMVGNSVSRSTSPPA